MFIDLVTIYVKESIRYFFSRKIIMRFLVVLASIIFAVSASADRQLWLEFKVNILQYLTTPTQKNTTVILIHF